MVDLGARRARVRGRRPQPWATVTRPDRGSLAPPTVGRLHSGGVFHGLLPRAGAGAPSRWRFATPPLPRRRTSPPAVKLAGSGGEGGRLPTRGGARHHRSASRFRHAGSRSDPGSSPAGRAGAWTRLAAAAARAGDLTPVEQVRRVRVLALGRGAALARARRERRASSMSAAWDSSPSLSPVPWGERSREAFNCVPGDQQSPRWSTASAPATGPSLLIIGAKARDARRTVPALVRGELVARGSTVGVLAGVGGHINLRSPRSAAWVCAMTSAAVAGAH